MMITPLIVEATKKKRNMIQITPKIKNNLSKTTIKISRYSTTTITTSATMVRAIVVATIATSLLIAPLLINCQMTQLTDNNNDCKHHRPSTHIAIPLNLHATRQQRQFNPAQQNRLTAINSNQSNGQQSHNNNQINTRSTGPEVEHEEFSLASNLQHQHQQQAHTSNYTLLPNQSQANVQEDESTGSGGQTGAKGQIGGQMMTDSSTTMVSNTTPALPNDSIGSPVQAVQPVVTTSSSVVQPSINSRGINNPSAAPSVSSTTQDSNQNNTSSSTLMQPPVIASADEKESKPRITSDETMARSSGGGSGLLSFGSQSTNTQEQHYSQAQTSASRHDEQRAQQQQQQMHNTYSSMQNNLPQPVSLSPSTITVITPLNGPPNSQQAQTSHSVGSSSSHYQDNGSQSMMKPIFVVGNPISERDYTSSSSSSYQYDAQQQSPVQQGQQQQQQQTSGSEQMLPPQQQLSVKAPKSVETSSMTSSQAQHNSDSQPHQQQKVGNNHSLDRPSPRIDKSSEMMANGEQQVVASSTETVAQPPPNTTGGHINQLGSDRMGGPPLAYSDGHLGAVSASPSAAAVDHSQQQQQQQQTGNGNSTSGMGGNPQVLTAPSPRLFQASNPGAAVVGNNPRRPSLPPPVNQANAASGFRSPLSPSGPLIGGASTTVAQSTPPSSLQPPINSLMTGNLNPNFYQTSPPYAGANMGTYSSGVGGINQAQSMQLGYNKPAFVLSQNGNGLTEKQQVSSSTQTVLAQNQVPTPLPGMAPGSGRRPLNITRVEHISAECSNDLIRAVIVFNGTFKGIIYSSGYVSDPTCLYVNGTGSTRYEFSIRLNQCGTLGRQELHQPTIPGEARRRDQVMWNTLSIQYNSIIEQEWDEHFRVSCEYGSDFWKTVSFSPFNVETNTGSPVVFTINPPQCQMDVLLGHGMGPKIAVDGPVTVGDPLTLLIHMKSEKAGYDILVKNCVAHNGGKQRMQLIDSNGCVVNERFISPFRGTYNDNDLRHVTLYAYLKAFRFTGSPVLYLECEIHMCQSACPPQMCYWRRLSKRSVDDFEYEYTTNSSSLTKSGGDNELPAPVISDSLNLFKALQVRQEPEPTKQAARNQLMREIYAEDDEAALVCYRHKEVCIFLTTIASLLALVITIAITCCCRIRKLTRSQFEHNRLATASSLSPSLLSISDAISSASSLMGSNIIHSSSGSNRPTNKTNHLAQQSWLNHPHHHHHNKLHRSAAKPTPPPPAVYLQRQQQSTIPPPITTFQSNRNNYAATCSPTQTGR